MVSMMFGTSWRMATAAVTGTAGETFDEVVVLAEFCSLSHRTSYRYDTDNDERANNANAAANGCPLHKCHGDSSATAGVFN